MVDTHLRTNDPKEPALWELFHAIASHDPPEAVRILTELPQLACMSLPVGATRQESVGYFFPEIAHYAYAGDTALHIAGAAHERDIAAELVARGADVAAKNRRGAQPLHYAADGNPDSENGNADAQYVLIEFLIRAGADPDAVDKNGVAPLHRAVRTRSTSAVRALLTNGADVLKRNKGGTTPLHLAVQNTGRGGSGSAASRREQAEIIRLLLHHGARASDKNNAGVTVKECGNAEWIRDLLGSVR